MMQGFFPALNTPTVSLFCTGTKIADKKVTIFTTGGELRYRCEWRLAPCVFYLADSKAAAALQMIIFVMLTGGALGGCQPLIKAIVNGAENAVEIKLLLFRFP